jgi:DNA replication protein DnaC
MKILDIKRLANDLRLFGFLESLERRLKAASHDGQTSEELLIYLLEDEKQYRKNLSAKRLDSKAKFRRIALLEDWDFSVDRGITKTKIRELSSLKFWDLKKNIIINGPTGCGKTQLSIALGKMACQNQLSVMFQSTSQIIEEMRAQKNSGKYIHWTKNLKKIDILIFDDFALQSYNHQEALFLIDLLEDRYQKKCNIFTSQVAVDGWSSLFEDAVTAQAILDRVKNPSDLITLTGKSYRERMGRGGPNAPTMT